MVGLEYQLGRQLLAVLGTVGRSDQALLAEVLVLRQQNAILRRQIIRVRYEPAVRAWFAALSRLIPRARWADVFPITPATLLTWHRRLAANKYTTTPHRPGRPRTKPSAKTLIPRMARDNPAWRHQRITGELLKIGHQIAKSTV